MPQPANQKLVISISISLVLAISLILRTYQLGRTGFWIDELSSIHFASHPWWGALLWDNSPPLYHLFLKFWLLAFGESEIAARSLSVVFSCATTLVWAREGFRRRGLTGLLLAGGGHAVFALSVLHGREARMYALFELLSTLFLIEILKTIETNRGSILRATMLSILLILTHYLSIVPISIGFGLLFFFRRDLINWKVLAIVLILLVACGRSFFEIRWESLRWQELKFGAEGSSRWPWETLGKILGGPIGATSLFLLLGLSFQKKWNLQNLIISSFIVLFSGATLFGYAFGRSVFLPRYFIYVIPLAILGLLQAHLKWPKGEPPSWKLKISCLSLAVFLGSQGFEATQIIEISNPPWREAAQALALEKNARVYTSRPLSLRTPYFDRASIDLQKLNSTQVEDLVVLLKDFEVGRKPWILENYWGYEYYRKNLEQMLHQHLCFVEDHSPPSSAIDSVVLLEIQCPRTPSEP